MADVACSRDWKLISVVIYFIEHTEGRAMLLVIPRDEIRSVVAVESCDGPDHAQGRITVESTTRNPVFIEITRGDHAARCQVIRDMFNDLADAQVDIDVMWTRSEETAQWVRSIGRPSTLIT